ncbi:MAG: HRDC domain-containing protein, partial [Defluviitaleaceae bacterium]|nr:HRDC domain-containing protein [Defluviitaleaceae bacterium]
MFLEILRGKQTQPPNESKKAEAPQIAVGRAFNADLLAELKELRLKIAREEGVPVFVVFSDSTLVDMCARLPADEDEFLSVSGVGQVKLAKYGAAFLEILRGKQAQPPNNGKKAEAQPIAVNRAFNADLLAELKELRLKIAREEGVPVFVV